MRFLHYHIKHKIVQNAEKISFFCRFFHFFALGFAYVKNLLYLCSRKGNSTEKKYRLQFNHNNHETQTTHTDDSLLPLHRTFDPP